MADSFAGHGSIAAAYSPVQKTSAVYQGRSHQTWIEDVEGSAVELPKGPDMSGPMWGDGLKGAAQSMIKEPSGRMRAFEAPHPSPHRHSGLATYVPRGEVPTTQSDLQAGIDRLRIRLNGLDGGAGEHFARGKDGRLLPTDILRCCQSARLPLDDSEIRAALARCQKDEFGRMSIDKFIESLCALHLGSRPPVTVRRLWDPAAPSKVPISKMLQAPLPSHAYRATDQVAPAPRRLASTLVHHTPWSEREAWDMLPASLGSAPPPSNLNQY